MCLAFFIAGIYYDEVYLQCDLGRIFIICDCFLIVMTGILYYDERVENG